MRTNTGWFFPSNESLRGKCPAVFHHVCSPDLRKVDALSVSEGDDLVKGEEQVERVVQDLCLVHRAAVLGDLQFRTVVKLRFGPIIN